MNEVAKGFRPRRFFELSDRDKRDLLKLMARVAEQAYRRGVQQGAGLVSKSSFRGDLWAGRYQLSPDLSPWVDTPTTITSLARLDAECGDRCASLASPGTTAVAVALALFGPAIPLSSAYGSRAGTGP